MVAHPAEGSPQAGDLQHGQSDERVADLRREIVLNRDRLNAGGLTEEEFRNSWQALFELARLRIRRQEFDQCLEDFALAAGPLPTAEGISDIERGGTLRPGGIWPPPYLEFHYHRGICRKRAGKNLEAIADFDRVIERLDVNVAHCRFYIDPGGWCGPVRHWRYRSLFDRGHTHLALRKFAQAIEDLTPTIDDGKPPEFVRAALKLRALAYTQTGQLDRALVDLTAALSHDPDSGDIYLLRGTVHEKSGRTAEACNDYRDALRHGAGDDKLAAKVEKRCAAGNRTAARQQPERGALERAAEERAALERAAEEGDWDALLALAQIYQDGGRYLEARRLYDRVLEFEAIEDWEREEAGPESVQTWERAYARLRELYAQAPLFPEPLEGWTAGEIEVSAEHEIVPLTGTAIRRMLSRTYRDATGKTVVVRFRLQDLGWTLVDALHDGDGGDPEKAAMVKALKNLGSKPFRKGDFRGTRTENALTGISLVVKLYADDFEGGVAEFTGLAADAYLERTDLAAARTLLTGHGFYRYYWGF